MLFAASNNSAGGMFQMEISAAAPGTLRYALRVVTRTKAAIEAA